MTRLKKTNLARLTRVLAAFVVTAHAGVCAAQNAVVMRASVSVPAGAPVLLRDVAEVSGPDSERLGKVRVLGPEEVAAGTAGAVVLERARVRTLMESAGVNWSRTTLNGGKSSVLVQAPTRDTEEMAATTGLSVPATTIATPTATPSATPIGTLAAIGESAAAVGVPAAVAKNPTLRTMILDRIALNAGVEPPDIRLRFDGTAAELAFLDDAIPPTWSLDITPVGTGLTGRTPVRIDAFDGDRVALRRTVQAVVLVRADVPLAAAAIARGQVLNQADVTLQERWLPPAQARVPAVSDLIGAQAKRRIEPGRPIAAADLESPVVIKRGEDVAVQAISGGVVVKTKAKALSSAREGERVTLQIDGSKKTFLARASGRGSAILNLTESPE